jgi:hypothetical protein
MFNVLEATLKYINDLPFIRINCSVGFPDDSPGESMTIFQVPGSTTVNTFMDGEKEVELKFQLFHKSKDQRILAETLWILQDNLEEMCYLPSTDGSFEFSKCTILNKPYIEGIDETQNFLYSLDFAIYVIVQKNSKYVPTFISKT